jgi:hypothetical protein
VAPVTLPAYLELEIALVVVAPSPLVNLNRPLAILARSSAVVGFTVAALGYRVHTFTEDTVHIERNYYGVLRVKEN